MPHAVLTTKTRILATALLAVSVTFAPAAWAADKGAKGVAKGDAKTDGKADNSVKRVSADKMKTYTSAIASAKAKNETTKTQIDKLRQEVKKIMVAPTFDKSSFIAKSNEIETLDTQMHKNLTEATAAALTQFTSEERQVLARSTRADNENGGGRRGGGGAKARKASGKAGKNGREGAGKASKASQGKKGK